MIFTLLCSFRIRIKQICVIIINEWNCVQLLVWCKHRSLPFRIRPVAENSLNRYWWITDTSDPRHFGPWHVGTSLVCPNCLNRSALVPKCPKDSSDLCAERSYLKCRSVLARFCRSMIKNAACSHFAQERSNCWAGRPFGHNRHAPKSGGWCAPFSGGAESPSNTMWPTYQVASWSIQSFGHTRTGPNAGGVGRLKYATVEK